MMLNLLTPGSGKKSGLFGILDAQPLSTGQNKSALFLLKEFNGNGLAFMGCVQKKQCV